MVRARRGGVALVAPPSPIEVNNCDPSFAPALELLAQRILTHLRS